MTSASRAAKRAWVTRRKNIASARQRRAAFKAWRTIRSNQSR